MVLPKPMEEIVTMEAPELVAIHNKEGATKEEIAEIDKAIATAEEALVKAKTQVKTEKDRKKFNVPSQGYKILLRAFIKDKLKGSKQKLVKAIDGTVSIEDKATPGNTKKAETPAK